MDSPIDFLRSVFLRNARADAFVFGNQVFTFDWLLKAIATSDEWLTEQRVPRGSTIALHGDFSPRTLATLLCMVERSDIIIPVAPNSENAAATYASIACPDVHVFVSPDEQLSLRREDSKDCPVLLRKLKDADSPGLVLFSSGTTGEPKGVVHDFSRLLRKYRNPRQCHRTLAFLLFDHIGGIDTALYNLANGSCLIIPESRTPEAVCRSIQENRVAVLPSAPSFLNLLAISGVWRKYDLSSLQIVTYGAEMMSESTLHRCKEIFPAARLMQKFGTSEVGTLRSKSRSSDSLWVSLGGEGYETRVREGLLEIKAESSMLGYLNAPQPFTEDGWFQTGDRVEVDGEFIRFLGRDSEMINVGGQKVFPAEIENVIEGLGNIREAAVCGEDNSLMGQIVIAFVTVIEPEDERDLQRRVRAACREALAKHKVPVKVLLSDKDLTNSRFKRQRRSVRSSDGG